jgi:pseudouridine-5'-monophosphatase
VLSCAITPFCADKTLPTADREAASHLLSFFPEIPLTPEAYLAQRNIAQNLRWPSVSLLPGVRKLVQHLHTHGVPIALATGSHRSTFERKTQHLHDVFACFEGNTVCGDDVDASGAPIRGKPCPDVFLVAARERLGRPVGTGEQGQCSEAQAEERRRGLVFEDALPGMRAGKRAGMSGVCEF